MWKRRTTRSLVRCDGCDKRVSIVTDRKEGDSIIIMETPKKDRVYYERGKRRLCPDCHEKEVGPVATE